MGKLTDKVAKGVFWVLLEKFGIQLAHFVVTLVLARLLTPNDYGTVALLSVFIAIANVLVDCGFGKALVQKKRVFVYRDNNRDMVYDLKPEKLDTGVFGINIHRSNEFKTSVFVNKYSAGSQVFADPDQFRSFMRLCEKQREYFKSNSFTYTLLNESDLIYSLTGKKK